MASYNKILLMGNLTRDPQLSYTPSQTAVVDFGLATNRKWNAQDGSQRDETCFVDCRAFGRMAENINKFFKKGKPIFVEGRLSFDQWTGQDGVKRSKHRVTVENFTFLPGTGAGGGPADQQFDPGAGGGYDESGPAGPGRPAGPVPNDEIPF
ncbi:MAG: single-stranded DNA-binding protein [Phycisphaerae bacterium]|nr:single-stranded DNA-binding protein [Phycisphaerae bacterium]